MVGPSASGSLKGTPTSMMSETSAATRSASTLVSRVGYPAVRYGISARRLSPRSVDQVCFRGDSDKVIANRDPIARRIGDLDDRAAIGSALIFVGETDLRTRRRHWSTIGVDRDPDQGTLELLSVRIGRGHDADLEGVENDAGSYRVDPNQIDQRLDQHPIVASVGVLPHFPQHLIRL